MKRTPLAKRPPPPPLGVSVVITTFNRPKMLARLLDQVARQTLPPREVIVVDDLSDDWKAVQRAIAPFHGRIRNLRILRKPEKLGLPSARNAGILAAKHPLIAFSDDDDEWRPDKLRRQVEVFRKAWAKVDLVYTWHLTKIHDKGVQKVMKPVHRGVAIREILWACFFQPSSVLAKREALIQAGLFDPRMRAMEDWEMWVRFFRRGFTCERCPIGNDASGQFRASSAADMVEHLLEHRERGDKVPDDAIAELRADEPGGT